METQTYFQKFTDLVWLYGVKVLVATVILIAGIWLIRRVVRVFRKFLQRRNIDPSLRPFFVSLVDAGLKVLLLLVVANNAGLKTTSFLALFSAMALVIGLALQGSLGNFASGVMILLFRPFRVGDWLEVEGKKGYVSEIQIFNTVIVAPDGRLVIIPNAKMTQGIIEKIGAQGAVRVELIVTLENGTDLEQLENLARQALEQSAQGLKKKGVEVEALAFPGNGVRASVQYWTRGEHFQDAAAALRRELKKAAAAAGLSMTIE